MRGNLWCLRTGPLLINDVVLLCQTERHSITSPRKWQINWTMAQISRTEVSLFVPLLIYVNENWPMLLNKDVLRSSLLRPDHRHLTWNPIWKILRYFWKSMAESFHWSEFLSYYQHRFNSLYRRKPDGPYTRIPYSKISK